MYPNYHVTLAGSMTIQRSQSDNEIVVNGSLSYVLVNATSLTKGVFWYLPRNWRCSYWVDWIFTGLTLLVRRWWGRIRVNLIF